MMKEYIKGFLQAVFFVFAIALILLTLWLVLFYKPEEPVEEPTPTFTEIPATFTPTFTNTIAPTDTEIPTATNTEAPILTNTPTFTLEPIETFTLTPTEQPKMTLQPTKEPLDCIEHPITVRAWKYTEKGIILYKITYICKKRFISDVFEVILP